MADRIFRKFHANFWVLNDRKVIQPGKNLIFGKKPEISLKVEIFRVGKKKFPFVPFHFSVYMMHHSCLYDSAETACFGKIIHQVIYENALNQSDCKIFLVLISQKPFEVYSSFLNVVKFS